MPDAGDLIAIAGIGVLGAIVGCAVGVILGFSPGKSAWSNFLRGGVVGMVTLVVSVPVLLVLAEGVSDLDVFSPRAPAGEAKQPLHGQPGGAVRKGSPVVRVTDASFEQDVLLAQKPVLLDFWATSSGPNKAMAPALFEIAEERAEQLVVARIAIYDNMLTAQKYDVRNLPTLILFRDGQVLGSHVGALGKDELADWIDSLL